MKTLILFTIGLFILNCPGNAQTDSIQIISDSIRYQSLNEIVISSSRVPENILRSPVSIEQLNSKDAHLMGAPSCFDAMENLKGVQIITPSLGFKVINTRGFANTTNVRFTQLVDGIDNQAPHIGAAIANALGANDLDISTIEIVPGSASALYGMNSINGLVNIHTKNPFVHQGLTIQQLSGVNLTENINSYDPQLFSQTNLRYAKAINSRFAFKINGSVTSGHDWIAGNKNDLAPSLNSSTGLTGSDNPAYDEVNSYGNESSNRRTLTLNGKKYVVARTGYRESDIEDYEIRNYKGDAAIYYRPKAGHELSLSYKGALFNNIYQRSNRFKLQDYSLHQYAFDYRSSIISFRTYLTQENTGRSYNIRSLAENIDRAFKSDDKWYSDYSKSFNTALAEGIGVISAHKVARTVADKGRYEPGTDAYKQKKEELININNWDYGAALRVKSYLSHTEALLNWDKLFQNFFEKHSVQVLSGIDYRTYIIIPDGNYFINPVNSSKNILYSKFGGFTQVSKDLLNNKLRLSASLRADKADYFDLKFTPRVTAVYSPREEINFRLSYQSGYRYPSIFEGYSNVNSGGVKRVGGLRIMSDGVFENSYTKASIDGFQAQVTNDVNTLGFTQTQAIEKNKKMLKKNTYTYLQPEHVRSLELGFRGLALTKRLYIDFDFYYNIYENFIAQVEASVPKTNISDSIPAYLFSKTKQDRYRLWTNSQSKIYNYGSGIGIKYRCVDKIYLLTNVSYSKLDKTEFNDGLEDGYNTPVWMINGTVISEDFWKYLGASVTARYQTKFDYVSFLVSGEVPAYCTMDAQINYNFKRAGLLTKIGATNLFNRPYYSILGGPSVGAFYYLSLIYQVKNK